MQRVLIVSGVLGLGTALVFGAAALTASLFPNGTTVAGNVNGVMWEKGWGGGVPMPVPAPIIVDDGGKGFVAPPGARVLPGVDLAAELPRQGPILPAPGVVSRLGGVIGFN